MRYSKIIAIFAINIMIISGMSAVVGARFLKLSDVTDEISDEGTIKLLQVNSIFVNDNIFVIDVKKPTDVNSRLKGYYPINLHSDFPEFERDGLEVRFTGTLHFPSIISRRGLPVFLRGYIPIKLTSIKELDDELNLLFDIKLEESYLSETPISVRASLKNLGEIPVIVDEMDPVVSTLDLIIETPDGETLQYIGERERRLPEKIELPPGQEIVYNFEDITEEGLFGNEESGSYRFILGEYNIIGEYTTKIEILRPDGEIEKEELVKFESKQYKFEITDETQETVELILSTDPKEIPNEVFEYTEPLKLLPIFDGNIHAIYELGTEVTIEVDELYEDFIFDQYLIDASGTNPIVTITMDRNKSVVAQYKKDQPEPIPPKACFSYIPEAPVADNEIIFNSDCSYDEDGEIVSYLWDFDDGTDSEEINPVHSFEEKGNYNVTLTVTDDDGLKGICSQTIIVIENEIPDTGLIFGKITELSELEEKKPIAEAKIKVFSTDGTNAVQYSTTSDEEGYYELKVEIGEYKVQVTKEEYKSESKTILVEADTENEVNFELEKIVPDLFFDISVRSIYFSERTPLIIEASITNNQESSIEVSEISLELQTLKLLITTPDGKTITTKPGAGMVNIPPKVEIKPHETYTVIIDDLTIDDFVVVLPHEDDTEPYNFIPGEYVIKGIYISWGPLDGRWHGRLVSKEKIFEFREIDG